ncbi:hypothetical protein [Clostridium formicaceticum]|uniref:Uncharacterized protein n=1 Tax=Clostridium formicaceticum TaxID=1497 RepID=A0AAC9WGB2_9CLOT|nr:hypothetical protein [Clostridium formicaceticum]AOY76163.1 hypothetical protein BJL90_09765 [Clostridium formicaceticum]ARE86535.1 hypothetical protein CLFO_08570 [Clostridium formicaceticum]
MRCYKTETSTKSIKGVDRNIFKKIKQVEHLELISTYVFEFSSVDEVDKEVDVFNAYVEVVYAEANYLKSQN